MKNYQFHLSRHSDYTSRALMAKPRRKGHLEIPTNKQHIKDKQYKTNKQAYTVNNGCASETKWLPKTVTSI